VCPEKQPGEKALGVEIMSKENSHQKIMKRGAAIVAMALAAMLPLVSMAESANQTVPQAPAANMNTAVEAKAGGRGRFGRMAGGMHVDVSRLTDEQKAAYDSAIALYEQVEDSVLSDLAAANIVTQADVDAYVKLRAAQKSLNEMDQTGWTAEQYKAYYEANAKTGDERKAAMQALASAGQLTQDQADALCAQGEAGLWAKILQNANTNSTIQTAVSTMRQAMQTLNGTLRDAGIEGMGIGMMFEGFQNGAMKFMQNFGSNNTPAHMQKDSGGRK
jgi:hypothetical protein